ncbi:MAG: hypothetical protein R3C56_30855 [Pirellulaceae bacterium]
MLEIICCGYMKNAWRVSVLLASLCMASPEVLQVSAADTVFHIQDEVLHSIDPRLFGQFMERPSWGEIGPEGALVPGTHRLQPKVVDLLAEMQPPMMRFPGGTDVDFMDWRDMVSNVPGRGAEHP